MEQFKLIGLSLILAVALLSTGCIPVCCGPEPEPERPAELKALPSQ